MLHFDVTAIESFPVFRVTVRTAAAILAFEQGTWNGIDFPEEELRSFVKPGTDDTYLEPHEFGNVQAIGSMRRAHDALEQLITKSVDAGRLKPREIRRSFDGNLIPELTWLSTHDVSSWAAEHGFELNDWWNGYVDQEERIAVDASEFLEQRRRRLENAGGSNLLRESLHGLDNAALAELIVDNHKQLHVLKTELANHSPSPRRTFAKREVDTLLKLVIGMAIAGYGYDPDAARSDVAPEIVSDLAKLGLSVTDDTVRKWLKEAAKTVLSGSPPKV